MAAVGRRARPPQRRGWAFTVWPGHLLEDSTLEEWFDRVKGEEVHAGLRYMVMQHEHGSQEGGHHVQGYVHYTDKKRASAIGMYFKLKPESFQAGIAKASDNRAYCTKDDARLPDTEFWEYGECPGSAGERTDLAKAADILKEPNGLKRCYEEHTTVMMKYKAGSEAIYNHFKRARLDALPVPTEPCNLYVAWGTPGSGKSYWANNFDPDNTHVLGDMVKGGPLWLTGYDGQRTLLIEDYEGEIPYRSLMRMCDKYRMDFKVHGGVVPKQWTNVVITSNQHPKYWYPHQFGDNWEANFGQAPGPLMRRCTGIVEFNGVYPETNYTFEGQEPSELGPMNYAEILAASQAPEPLSDTELTELFPDAAETQVEELSEVFTSEELPEGETQFLAEINGDF